MSKEEPPKKSTARKRRWCQFSLRTLLVAVFLFALPCSWLAVKMRDARKQQEVAEALEPLGWYVEYDDSLIGTSPSVRSWLRNLLGDHFLKTAVLVHWMPEPLEPGGDVRKTIDDRDFNLLRQLPKLREMILVECEISPGVLRQVAGLASLESLSIYRSFVDHRAWNGLSRLSKLKELDLSGTNVRDSDLAFLAEMGQIRRLILQRTRVTDAGLEHFGALPKLESLELTGCRITDKGVPHLVVLSNLHDLDLSGTRVTAWAWPQLRQIPHLEVLQTPIWEFTDQALPDLQALGTLRRLQVDWCSFDTLKKLQRALPSVDVNAGFIRDQKSFPGEEYQMPEGHIAGERFGGEPDF